MANEFNEVTKFYLRVLCYCKARKAVEVEVNIFRMQSKQQEKLTIKI